MCLHVKKVAIGNWPWSKRESEGMIILFCDAILISKKRFQGRQDERAWPALYSPCPGSPPPVWDSAPQRTRACSRKGTRGEMAVFMGLCAYLPFHWE